MRRLVVPVLLVAYVLFGFLIGARADASENNYTGTAPTVTAPPSAPIVPELPNTGAGSTLSVLFAGVLIITFGTLVLGEAYRRRGQGYGAYGKVRKNGRHL